MWLSSWKYVIITKIFKYFKEENVLNGYNFIISILLNINIPFLVKFTNIIVKWSQTIGLSILPTKKLLCHQQNIHKLPFYGSFTF